MKWNKKLTYFVSAAILGMSLAGCRTTSVESLDNGYEEVTYTGTSISEPEASRISLQYRKPSGGRIVVWPSVGHYVINNDVAVFIGGKAELYNDGVERLRQRLIAFKAPSGPPMDITDQVLQQYCAKSGVAFTNIIKDSYVSLVKTNDELQILFGIIRIGERGPNTITDHDAYMTISWHDIEAIMQDVKQNGKLKKEKWSGMEYSQND